MKILDQIKHINDILVERLKSGKESVLIIQIERSKATVSDCDVVKIWDTKDVVNEEKSLME